MTLTADTENRPVPTGPTDSPRAKPSTEPDNLRPRPYVGVSGVVTPRQQRHLEAAADAAGLRGVRQLLHGVKATHKTLWDRTENKYGRDWYPVGDDELAAALSAAPDITGSHAGHLACAPPPTLRVAQIYLDLDHVADPTYRRQFMTRLRNAAATWLTGVQFDMLPWHTDPALSSFLDELKTTHGLQVLLQCHGPAMRELGPRGAAAALAPLAPAVDYVLFDSSHGTGTRLDTRALHPFLDAAHSNPALDRVGFAVAGGLNPDRVTSDLSELLSDFPDLSWDAEGALHPMRTDGTRPLDLDVAAAYLDASARLLTA